MSQRSTIVIVVGVILALNLLVIGVDLIFGGDEVVGPSGSSYVTTGDGTAAWYALAGQAHHPMSRLRNPVEDLDPGSTLIVADASPLPFSESETDELNRFVALGGRLILVGATTPDPILDELIDAPPSWSPIGSDGAGSTGWTKEIGYVESVVTGPIGSYPDDGSALPLLIDGDKSVVLISQRGSGWIVLVSDPTLFSNALIGTSDNAALALGVLGEDERPVVFDEYVHGYADAAGFTDSLPSSWISTFWLLLLALVVYLLAMGKRTGPIEQVERDLAPSRGQYLDAVAGTLARNGQPHAAAGAIRSELQRHFNFKNQQNEDVRLQARRAGLDDSEIETILTAPAHEDGWLKTGSALATMMVNRSTGDTG